MKSPFSFRVRMAMWSAGASGVVLLGFGFWALTTMYSMGLERIDREIQSLGERQLTRGPDSGHWGDVEDSLNLVFGEGEEGSVLLLVRDRDGEVLQLSSYWPADLSVDRFPALDWDADIRRSFPPPQQEPFDRPPPPGDRNGLGERTSPEERDGFGENPPRGGGDGFDRRPPPRFDDGFGQRPRRDGFDPSQPPPRPRGSNGGPPDGGPPPRIGEGQPRPGDAGYRQRRPPRNNGPRLRMPLRAPSFETVETQEGRWRIGLMGNPNATLVMGVTLEPFFAEAVRLRMGFLFVTFVALLLIVAGGWLISSRALRPIRVLSRTVEQISSKGLEQRIPDVERDPEFRDLIDQFNAMMARLERSFGQAVRFSADASHELKTPLTVLQGQLEEAVRNEEAGSAHQVKYSKLIEEVQRLKSIVRKLLLLSMADSNQLRLNAMPISISEIAGEVAEDAGILAKSVDIQTKIEPEVWVSADETLLRQVVQNLCTNAAKYNLKGGKIRMHLKRKNDMAVFTVWNTGSGIAPEDREQVFDRFYRADKARGRKVGGVGLGLSLAREIARAHSGDLVLEEDRDGWTGFRLTLPLLS